MGANAQTTVPTFTAGEVLTAAQMNNSARTGVPVFADTTARDAGFGGTGEKVLAEGQLCYLESTNVVQYYDGSTWSTVGPSSSGLVRLTGPTTFTSVTSIAFPNDTFTTTYRFHKVMLAIRADSTPSDLSLQFRNNSGAQNAAQYYGAITGLIYTGGAADNLSSAATSAAIGSVGTNGGSYDITVAEAADSNRWGTVLLTSFGNDRGRSGGLIYAQQVASTGLVFTGTTNVTGSYTVYGMAES